MAIDLDLTGSHLRNTREVAASLGAVDVNARGGMQSRLEVRYDLLDGRAMDVLANVLHEGAKKYAPDNWRLIDELDHVNHALMHLMRHLDVARGRLVADGEDDLAHALCRLHMAVAMREQGGVAE